MKRKTPLRSDPDKVRAWKDRSRRENPLRSCTPIAPVNRKRKARRRKVTHGDKAAWVTSLPCLVCGRTPSEPHHEPPRSRGGRKEHLTPLCADHHTLAPDSRHRLGSVERFRRAHDVDLKAEAGRIELRWRERG